MKTTPLRVNAPERVLTRAQALIKATTGVALCAVLATSCSLPSLALAAENTGGGTSSPQQNDATSEPPDGKGGSSLGEPPDGKGGGSGGSGQGSPGGGANTQSFDYSGSYSATLSADGQDVQSDGQSIDATESLTNAALAEDGGTLTLTNAVLSKSGDSEDGDSCNFYGVNSVLLAVGEGSKAVVSNTQVNATSTGSNALFATDGASVLAREVEISTSQDNSRGLDATYGGTILAEDVSVQTQGEHSAAFATDRGGGNVSVEDATVNTAGSGSPLVYSTGAIEIEDVTGVSTGSQIAGMEGLNTILISDSTLESTVTGKTASDPVANGVIIYQSTSGDAETATGEAARFQATDSTLKSAIQSGSMFYCTNTTANVVLEDTLLDFDSNSAALVSAAGNDSNSWGKAGSNGATISFTGIGETFAGNATADTVSQLSLYLLEGTTWTGAAEIVENSAGSSNATPLTVNVDGTSTWTVTQDCTVSALNVAAGGSVVDASGKTATIVTSGQTVVAGEGGVTVTVTGDYSTTVSIGEGQRTQEPTIDRGALEGTDTNDSDEADDSDKAAGTDSTSDTTTNDDSVNNGGFFAVIWNVIRSLIGW